MKKEDEQKKKRGGQSTEEEGSPGTGAQKRKRTEESGSASSRGGRVGYAIHTCSDVGKSVCAADIPTILAFCLVGLAESGWE